MTETRIPLSPEDIEERNTILRKKRRGVLLSLGILILISAFPIWFLQTQEKVDPVTLWVICGIMAMVMLVAIGCYSLFARQIGRDLLSPENVLVPAVVEDGWQNNERRDALMTVNINGYRVKLSANVLKRHLDDATDLDNMAPGSELLVEMAPASRVIIRIERLT